MPRLGVGLFGWNPETPLGAGLQIAACVLLGIPALLFDGVACVSAEARITACRKVFQQTLRSNHLRAVSDSAATEGRTTSEEMASH